MNRPTRQQKTCTGTMQFVKPDLLRCPVCKWESKLPPRKRRGPVYQGG